MVRVPVAGATRGRVPARWRERMLWDVGLAAVLSAAVFIPQIQSDGVHLSELPTHRGGLLAVAVTLGQCLPLVVRRRWPGACLIVVACSFAAAQSMGWPSSFAAIGLFVALYSAGAHADRFRRELAAAATVAYIALAVLLYYLRSPERPLDYVTFYLVLLACWSGGAWIRARQAGEAERSRKEADVAIERERAHIARELHDVVTHHVTAMVVQADAAGYLLPGSPDRVTESLAAIGGTGRQALTELRQLLGVLDASGAGGAPANAEQAPPAAPGLLLSELVTRTKQAGQPVYLAEDGAPTTVAADVGLAAYRVVQEGLTNAVKHAPGRHTAVRVRYGKELEVEVTTDGPVITAGDFTPGRGLSGLQDRVRACGGTLMAGGKPGGGFTVLARIPSEAAT